MILKGIDIAIMLLYNKLTKLNKALSEVIIIDGH